MPGYMQTMLFLWKQITFQPTSPCIGARVCNFFLQRRGNGIKRGGCFEGADGAEEDHVAKRVDKEVGHIEKVKWEQLGGGGVGGGELRESRQSGGRAFSLSRFPTLHPSPTSPFRSRPLHLFRSLPLHLFHLSHLTCSISPTSPFPAMSPTSPFFDLTNFVVSLWNHFGVTLLDWFKM